MKIREELIRRVAQIVANYSPNQPRGSDGRWSSGGSGGSGSKSSGGGKSASKAGGGGESDKKYTPAEAAKAEISGLVTGFRTDYVVDDNPNKPEIHGYAAKPVEDIHRELQNAGFAKQPSGHGEDFTRFTMRNGAEVQVDKYQAETIGYPKGSHGVRYFRPVKK